MGIACKDFVMLAADMTKAQSILVMKNGMIEVSFNENQMFHISCGLNIGK